MPARTRGGHACRSADLDPADPALPVAGSGRLSHVRKSRTGKWRAAVLIAVHLLVVAHVTHYLLRGRTLSPVEPSESMYTLELGELNAGFVFLLAAVLSTAIFGRFFCGWGCHIVALQDLCGWAMKKMGIRPRPFRSRLLLWVPLIVALYMFVWPTLKRVAAPALRAVGRGLLEPVVDWLLVGTPDRFPGFTNHLVTEGFWDTFPGPLFAVLTFVSCGFVAVYLLGAKGFCTYGCPYGGLFVQFDRLSFGRIVVNDRCEQCGHCTATCTSNVLVHEEVRRFGRVVDPGCMKCMDCVSVCPKEALSFGFGLPSLMKGPAADHISVKRFRYSIAEELLLGASCALGFFAFRGLYDGPPLLMSVGLGAITAFLALELWHLLRRPQVRLQQLTLKLGGRLTPSGRIAGLVAAAWLVLALHSSFVQWHRYWGRYHLDRTEVSRADGLNGAFHQRSYSARHDRSLGRAGRHFGVARQFNLFVVPEVELGRAWYDLLTDDVDGAVAGIRRAIAAQPANSGPYEDLSRMLAARGRLAEATAVMLEKVTAFGASAQERFTVAGMLTEQGRFDEAVEQFRLCVGEAPDVPDIRYNYGGLLRRVGRPAEAVEQLEAASNLDPTDFDTRVELGLAYRESGNTAAAVREFRAAIAIAPDRPEAVHHLPTLIQELE